MALKAPVKSASPKGTTLSRIETICDEKMNERIPLTANNMSLKAVVLKRISCISIMCKCNFSRFSSLASSVARGLNRCHRYRAACPFNVNPLNRLLCVAYGRRATPRFEQNERKGITFRDADRESFFDDRK